MHTQPRGFTILIVLAVIAAASVILATQLSSVEHQQGAERRAVEQIKARDIAEYCLDVADAYVQDYGATNPTLDFDRLLDPNGVVEAAGDDFVPPATLIASTTSIVSVPPGRAGSRYRWRAFDVASPGAGGSAGTCFVRFDDNADDANSTLSAAMTSNTGGVVEGPAAGVDVAERDRDRTLVISAIGVVPQQASQASAYVNAHARVTVKRVRAMPINAAAGAAIEAGGAVTFSGSVCGAVSGVVADSISGGACICGQLDAQLVSGSEGTAPGDCGCASCASDAGSTIGAGPRPDPTVTVPAFSSLLKNEAFGPSGATTANNIASATYGAAVVYFRDSAAAPAGYQPANSTDVFAWDAGDTDTRATLGAATGAPSQSCTDTSALDPLPSPCNWGSGALPSTTVTCAATESPCWKLVARLGVAGGDIGIAAGVQAQHSDGGALFQPKAGVLPNFKTPTSFDTWAKLAPGSCTTCAGTTVVTRSGAGAYTVAPQTTAAGPHMVAVIDTLTTATVTQSGAATEPAQKVSVFSNATIAVSGNQCCATCNCPNTCSTTAGYTRAANGAGYAVRSNKACTETGLAVFGVMQCPELDVGNNGCIVGGLALTRDPGDIDCTLPGTAGTGFCSTASFCAKNSFDIVGDLLSAGNVCMKNDVSLSGGSIQSQENIGWKNNLTAAAHIVAVHNVVGVVNTTITFDGTAGAAGNQGVASQMWIDAQW